MLQNSSEDRNFINAPHGVVYFMYDDNFHIAFSSHIRIKLNLGKNIILLIYMKDCLV